VARELVTGSATAGGMQPAPVDVSDPGGQAAMEQAADIGHRHSDERAGLLEAEVVRVAARSDRQPASTGSPRGRPRRGPGRAWPRCGGARRAAPGQVGHEHQLTGLAFGVAGEQRIDQAAGRLGNPRVQQRGRADDQDGAGLQLASGGWWEQQAEVPVGDPARRRTWLSALG
jgi:hypothetical protein